MTIIYTGQLAKRHIYAENKLVVIDTTVKSGMKEFAPTWDMVMGVKSEHITPEEYSINYKSMMGASYKLYKQAWINVLSIKEPVILCCYCKEGKFCHRHLLANYFDAVGRQHGFEMQLKGEFVLPDNNFAPQISMFD